MELVKLLACCTMGKNVNTEIKCHSMLSLDGIVDMVSHEDCIPEARFFFYSVNIVNKYVNGTICKLLFFYFSGERSIH